MYERITDRARKTMQLANQEAIRFNHDYIGPEHILLALVKDGAGVAAIVLTNLGIELRRIRQEVERLIDVTSNFPAAGRLVQTPRAKKVIERAIEEARSLDHYYVGTEHLMLGLLRDNESIAGRVLAQLGLNLERVRAEVMNILGTNLQSRPAGSYDNESLYPKLDLPELNDAYREIERLTEQKEDAVGKKEFERAPNLRDQAEELWERICHFVAERRKQNADKGKSKPNADA